MAEWNTIEDMFLQLHSSNFCYIILRNYEEIDEDNFYTSGHADIDFLAVDGYKFAKKIHAYPRFIDNDGIHYKVNIAGTEVIIDVRSVGDGYYDTKWEKKLLTNRQFLDGRFYIADKENYYYSLIYHSILQKERLADDYLYRLNQMAAVLGFDAHTEQDHLANLEYFMKVHGYSYTIPFDIHVPLRKELVNPIMIKKYPNVYMRDAKIKLMQIGSKVKHKVLMR